MDSLAFRYLKNSILAPRWRSLRRSPRFPSRLGRGTLPPNSPIARHSQDSNTRPLSHILNALPHNYRVTQKWPLNAINSNRNSDSISIKTFRIFAFSALSPSAGHQQRYVQHDTFRMFPASSFFFLLVIGVLGVRAVVGRSQSLNHSVDALALALTMLVLLLEVVCQRSLDLVQSQS